MKSANIADLTTRIIIFIILFLGVLMHNEIVIINLCGLNQSTKLYLDKKVIEEDLLSNSENNDILKRFDTTICEMEEKFNDMSLNDIFNFFKVKIDNAEKIFRAKNSDRSIVASENINEIVNSFRYTPEVGLPFYNDIMNTIVRGQRKGKFYISSSGSGQGKSRALTGEMCHLVYPFRYNKTAKRWIQNGFNKKADIIIIKEIIK